MSAHQMRRELPPWALWATLTVALAALAFIGWRALTGYEAAPGPSIPVRPGMYDMRKELFKAYEERQKTGAPTR